MVVRLRRNRLNALFEGTLNWYVYSFAHQYLIIHAGAIERNGLTAILPAPPGSGKSTLCAALVHRGWRLLTDELTLIEPASCMTVPLVRPISLRDESLDVIRRFVPGVVIGLMSLNTVKGNVAHVLRRRGVCVGWVHYAGPLGLSFLNIALAPP
jgi:HprK-related kinase A